MASFSLLCSGLSGALALIAFAALFGGAAEGLAFTALWLSSGSALLAALLLLRRARSALGAALLGAYTCLIVCATLAHSFTPRMTGASASALQLSLWATLPAAAFLGSLLSTHPGLLLPEGARDQRRGGSRRRRLLPLHFGATSLGSAAALLELFFRLPSLWALAAVAALLETFLAIALEGSERGRLERSGGLLAGPASLALRLVGLVGLSDLAFLVGAVAGRSRSGGSARPAPLEGGATPRALASAP